MSSFGLIMALVLPPVLGWLLTRLAAGRNLALHRLEWAALSWCLGWATITLGMFALGEIGVAAPWRPLPLFMLWLALASVLLALNRLCAPRARLRALGVGVMRPTVAFPRLSWRVLLGAGGAALVAFQCLAVVAHSLALPVNGEDAWSIWTFKARIFYLSRSIPAGYFHDASKLFSHPDYPLLVPLAETWLYGWLGRVDEWAVLLLFPPFFVALLAIVAGALSRAYDRAAGLIGTTLLACAPLVITWGSMGDADMPLTLAATASAAMLWRWLRGEGGWRALALSGVLAGVAVWTKKEGLILFGISAIIVAVAAWRGGTVASGVARLRGALVATAGFVLAGGSVATPWLLFVAVRHPLTRDFLPVTTATLLAHLDRLPTIVSFVALSLLDVWRWSVVWPLLLAVVVASRRRLRHERTLAYLLLLLLAQVACDGGLFIFSDWQPFTYHMATAFDRLLLHALPLAVLLVVGLAMEPSVASAAQGGASAPDTRDGPAAPDAAEARALRRGA